MTPNAQTRKFRPLLRLSSWLGFGQRPLVVGLHVAPEYLTMAALRVEPLRLVALGRRLTFDPALLHDEVRQGEQLTAEIRSLAAELGLSGEVPTVAAVEPRLSIVADDAPATADTVYDVSQRIYDRACAAVVHGGLDLIGIDAVPVAVARLALLVDPATGGEPRALDATRAISAMTLPRRLRSIVEPTPDGPAIGAALAALGVGPHPTVRPVPEEVTQLVPSPAAMASAITIDIDRRMS